VINIDPRYLPTPPHTSCLLLAAFCHYIYTSIYTLPHLICHSIYPHRSLRNSSSTKKAKRRLLTYNIRKTMSTTTTLPPTPPSEFASPVSTTKELASSMATAHATSGQQVLSPPEQQHIWVITGPAGCGKTSVAESLHQTYGMPYLEGDTVSF
jgi:hypothetical protein